MAKKEAANNGNTVRCKALLVRSDGTLEIPLESELIREHRVELTADGRFKAHLVCTGDNLEDLAVGRLVTEGVIEDAGGIEEIVISEDKSRIDVRLRKEAAASASEECAKAAPIKREWVFALVNAFSEDSRLHKSTGGTHTCLLGMEGALLYRAEDISRHNATDKAVGYAVRNSLDRSRCMLFTTGRVPTDMVQKVIAAKIPVLVSKSVPTGEAVELARQSGLQLICKAWPDSYERYGE